MEEEIEIIDELKNHTDYNSYEDYEKVLKLIDLYNKEKKEINRLQEENNELKLQLQYALNENNKDILKPWERK